MESRLRSVAGAYWRSSPILSSRIPGTLAQDSLWRKCRRQRAVVIEDKPSTIRRTRSSAPNGLGDLRWISEWPR